MLHAWVADAWSWLRWGNRFKLGLDGGEIRLKQVIQKTGLAKVERLGALGEAVAFEQGDFVGGLLVTGFVVQRFFIECFNLLIQMLDALEQLRSFSGLS